MVDTQTETEFYKILQSRINDYFEHNQISKKANAAMYFKIVVVTLIPVVGYFLLLTIGKESILSATLCYLLFSFGIAMLVVNIGHDASHQAISENKTVNKVLSFSWNLAGISKYLWEVKHHHSHHIYTNIPHEDVDIAESPLLRFSPTYPYKNYYRYQWLYSIPLYGFFGLFIIYVKDFVLLFAAKGKGMSEKSLPSFFLLRLILIKLTFLTVSLIIPLLTLPFPWWQILIMYVFSLAFAGALMLLVLVVPHINETATLEHETAHIKTKNEWILHQIHCTIDSSPNSKLLGWLSGGLNTHLIHHLYPHICHVHYIPLSGVIKKVLEEEGIPYYKKSFVRSLVDHFKYLKVLGLPNETVKKVA